MISLQDYVRLTKKGGIIDDSTDKPMGFGTVLGFCWLKNGVTGMLLNSKNYTIKEAYIGPDKLVHLAEWNVSETATKYLDSKKNIIYTAGLVLMVQLFAINIIFELLKKKLAKEGNL